RIADHTEGTETEGFDLGNAEGLVDRLAKLQVRALANIHELGAFRQARADPVGAEAKLVDQDDAGRPGFLVEGVDGPVVINLAGDEIAVVGPVDNGPTVLFLPTHHILDPPAGRDDRAERVENGRLAPLGKSKIEMLEHPDVAPQSLAENETSDVGEDPGRLVA